MREPERARLWQTIWLATVALLALTAAPSAGQGCDVFERLVLSPERRAQASEEEWLALGREGFEAAEQVKRTPYGGRREDGRVLDIPEPLHRALRRAAYRELVTAATGDSPDVIAVGNRGHQSDHARLLRLNRQSSERFPEGALREMFGVDPRDLHLIKLVHDLGKLPSTEGTAHIRAYISSRTDGDFLKTRILGHGFDSIARVAELVRREGDRLGVPRETQLDVFYQLADAIAWHNFGPETNRQQAARRYPGLSAEEVDLLTNAFWPRFFNQGIRDGEGRAVVSPFREDLGIGEYGGSRDRGVLQKLLALDDRAALVTEKAPDKIGNQNLKVADPQARTFHRGLITATFINPARETVVAVKAMGQELQPHVRGETRIEEYPAYRQAMEMSARLSQVGRELLRMNSDENLRRFGVMEEQADHTLLYESPDGTWWRIDGADKVRPVVTVRIGEGWFPVSGEPKVTEGSAFDVVMRLLRRDRRW